MSSNPIIKVTNLHKEFVLPQHKNASVKQAVVNAVRRNNKVIQKVLDGVSFEVEKGDFFGIVGRNGSGKSTLLKILAGVYSPTSGGVEMHGELTPFIELGVGFNPELSGRDNVFLNGALLGFSRKEMQAMYDDIVDFAELGPFMDQKLKNYSSGMQVRLAFSVAIKAHNSILIFDEVLAVGDEAFQRKCNDYFNQIRQDKDQTVILVTHSMDAVKKYCNKALLLQKGKVALAGSPDEVANEYTLENANNPYEDKRDNDTQGKSNSDVKNLEIKLLSDKLVDENGEITFMLEYDVTKDINTVPALSITDLDRNVWLQNDNMWEHIVEGKGHHKIRYSCKLPALVNDASVKVEASVWSDDEKVLAYVHEKDKPKVVIRRKDIISKYDEGVATGLLHIKGDWEIIR
jgi:ABC-2 type transport system ATP-binding protein